MRRLTILLFALVLVLAACGDDSSSADAADSVTTTAAHEEGDESSEDEHAEDEAAHEEGDESSEDEHAEDEAAHEEGDESSDDEHAEDEAAHEEGDEHSEDEHATDDDGHGEMVEGMSEEYIPEATGAVEASFTVEMHEFGFEVEGLELAPGMTVEFVLINNGALIHEFRLTTEHRAEEHVAAGHADHGAEGEDGHHGDRDIIVNVGPGETRTVVMTLPSEGEGFDHLACLIPGHYEAGMFDQI